VSVTLARTVDITKYQWQSACWVTDHGLHDSRVIPEDLHGSLHSPQ